MIGTTVPTEEDQEREAWGGVTAGAGERSEAPAARLDEATNSVEGPWLASIYDRAGEATVVFSLPPDPEKAPTRPGEGLDPERAQQEAARRAATALRRFNAHNGCDRMGSLTYRCRRCSSAPCSCTEAPDRPTDGDLDQVWSDVEDFRRRLYAACGGKVALSMVIEHHKDGSLHVHYATNRFVKKEVLARCWRHGFIDIRKFRVKGIQAAHVGQRERARIVAAYMSSYMKKDFTEGHQFARHRYSTTRGLSPVPRQIRAHTRTAALAWWVLVMGEPPARAWSSDDAEQWDRPPVNIGYWSGDPP